MRGGGRGVAKKYIHKSGLKYRQKLGKMEDAYWNCPTEWSRKDQQQSEEIFVNLTNDKYICYCTILNFFLGLYVKHIYIYNVNLVEDWLMLKMPF